jgi:hypothetical protein
MTATIRVAPIRRRCITILKTRRKRFCSLCGTRYEGGRKAFFLKKEAKNFFSCAFGALGLFGATAGTN